MAEQGRKLMAVIGVAVASLDKLEAIVPAVQALGRQHVGYGVRPAHYDTVGVALPWTLGQGLRRRLPHRCALRGLTSIQFLPP